MPHYSRGNIQFEHKKVGTVEGAEDVVETFSCYPPPSGRRTGSNPVLTIPPQQPSSFVQPGERDRVEKHAAKSGENLQFSTVIEELKKAFKINPMTIDLSKIPQNWRQTEPCFDYTIAVVVQSVLLRVDAVAKQAVTEGGVTWPKGDTLAQFRMIVPDNYRFIRHKTRNIKCCPLKEGEEMPEYDPERGWWHGNNFKEFSYFKHEWKLGADLRYRLRPEWEFRFDYRIEPSEEEEKNPIPWVFPPPKFGF